MKIFRFQRLPKPTDRPKLVSDVNIYLNAGLQRLLSHVTFFLGAFAASIKISVATENIQKIHHVFPSLYFA